MKIGKWTINVRYILLFIILAALLTYIPLSGNRRTMNIAIIAFLYIVLGESWNILAGMAGLFNIVHATFFGIGVYAISIGLSKFKLPVIVCILIGMIVNVLLATIVGYIGSKLAGLYFTMALIGVNQTIYAISVQWYALTGGTTGTSLPRSYLMEKSTIYLIGLGLAIFSVAVFALIRQSRWGTHFVTLRENPELSSALGSNIGRWRILATILSACLASLGGSFYAFHLMNNNPEVFSGTFSLKILMVVIVGGIGSVWGPVFGIILVVLDELVRGMMPSQFAPYSVIIYALALILVALKRPEGLISLKSVFMKKAADERLSMSAK